MRRLSNDRKGVEVSECTWSREEWEEDDIYPSSLVEKRSRGWSNVGSGVQFSINLTERTPQRPKPQDYNK